MSKSHYSRVRGHGSLEHNSAEGVLLLLQGDVHRFYRKLRQHWPSPPAGRIPELDHVREIADYYARLDKGELQLLLAWAKKEQSGIGMIPSALSGVPVIGLLFVPVLHRAFAGTPPVIWLCLWAVGTVTFVSGIYVHQRQHAYTALHVHILERLCAGEHPQQLHGRQERPV